MASPYETLGIGWTSGARGYRRPAAPAIGPEFPRRSVSFIVSGDHPCARRAAGGSVDKRMTAAQVVAELRDGMTLGIGGWGSRRKPMALVREILRSPVRDLTVVSYGGPDVGLLCAAGKVRKLVYGFVSLDSIPLEPHFRRAREAGALEAAELDEGMLQWGLYAQACRLPFLPTRAGLGSDVMRVNPGLRTVRSPYADGEELVAMPAIPLDVALVHMNRADVRGNAQFLGPDPYFDDLFCMAAKRRFLSCEQLVETRDFAKFGSVHTLKIHRGMVDGVVETPGGAHFTECPPDYGRDEAFQREYAAAAKDPDAWAAFQERFLAGESEAAYQEAVRAWRSQS
jgi:glutaconate CoA-transferase subunit A